MAVSCKRLNHLIDLHAWGDGGDGAGRGETTSRSCATSVPGSVSTSLAVPLREPARAPSGRPDGETRRAAQHADDPTDGASLSRTRLRDVVSLVDVHVVPGEDAPHQEAPVAMASDEPDLLRPRCVDRTSLPAA